MWDFIRNQSLNEFLLRFNSEHFDKTVSDCQDYGAKASVFDFIIHLQRVSLSSLDYNDFIAYKTVDWLYIQVHLNKLECRQSSFISVIQLKLWNSCK